MEGRSRLATRRDSMRVIMPHRRYRRGPSPGTLAEVQRGVRARVCAATHCVASCEDLIHPGHRCRASPTEELLVDVDHEASG